MKTSITSYGYKIKKKELTSQQISIIKKDLLIIPFVYDPVKNRQNTDKKFNILSESPSSLYVPRFYGIDNFGPPLLNKLPDGEDAPNLEFKGELRDNKQNGELIQITQSANSEGANSVAGVVMYDEGFILLTGSWKLEGDSIPIKSDSTSDYPRWTYFGAGALDGVNQTTAGGNFVSASFNLSFRGAKLVRIFKKKVFIPR